MRHSQPQTIVLASASPRRQELIQTLGLPVFIYPANIDESTNIVDPGRRVEDLSHRKAHAVYEKLNRDRTEFHNAIIVGSDTIVVNEGRVLGKPRDEQEAKVMLRKLSGHTHDVYSGVACIDVRSGSAIASHKRTKVTFKPINEQQIERYVATGEPMDKAGAYGIQGLGALLVESIEGDYFNVVGLPLSLLGDMLTNFGVKVI